MGHKDKRSLRTAVVLMLGVLAGTAVGWWTAAVRRSVPEGLLAGVATGSTTIRFCDALIETLGSVASTRVELVVNGQRHTVTVDNRISLLDLLRERLGFEGMSGNICRCGCYVKIVKPVQQAAKGR